VTGQDADPSSVDLVRDLLDRAPVPIVIFGSDRVILYTNGPFEAVFGYTRAEIVGRPYEALFPDRLQDELRGRVEDYLAHPEPPAWPGVRTTSPAARTAASSRCSTPPRSSTTGTASGWS
jgi:PAS domain S-box-containing protein